MDKKLYISWQKYRTPLRIPLWFSRLFFIPFSSSLTYSQDDIILSETYAGLESDKRKKKKKKKKVELYFSTRKISKMT